MNIRVRWQEKIDIVEKRDFRRGELPENIWWRYYMDKMVESSKKILKEVGEELVTIEVSFSKEKS